MADNVTAPFTDAVVATDEIAGAHYQRMKVAWGAEGTANDTSAANPLPVAVIGGDEGLTDAELRATPVPVSGTVAVTNSALTDIETNTEALRPASGAFAVTPHDSNNFSAPTRGLYVGGAGNVVAIIGGSPITFTAVPAGTILPIVATRVNNTSTTATAMVGLT